MHRVWRFLDTGYHDAATNMALDEALLLLHEAGASPPTLRVYGWHPPTLSVGYAQDVAREVDAAACQALGIALVRRPTGGRAVLHEQDVTYSVVLPIGLGGTTLAADYCRIGTALATALQGLGLPVSLARRHGAPPRTAAAACFAALSRYEIGVAGKKLVGSAQKRLQRTLLQHGSIPLWLDRERLLRCLRVADPHRAAAEAAATMTAVNELAPAPVAPAALHAALRQGFAATFGVDFTPASPTPQEWALAHYLRQTKYATAAWNLEGPVAWRRLASAAGVDATTSNRVLTVATPAGNV